MPSSIGLQLESKTYNFTIQVVGFVRMVGGAETMPVQMHQLMKASADLGTLCFELSENKDPKIKQEKLRYCLELSRSALQMLQDFDCAASLENDKANLIIDAAELTNTFLGLVNSMQL